MKLIFGHKGFSFKMEVLTNTEVENIKVGGETVEQIWHTIVTNGIPKKTNGYYSEKKTIDKNLEIRVLAEKNRAIAYVDDKIGNSVEARLMELGFNVND